MFFEGFFLVDNLFDIQLKFLTTPESNTSHLPTKLNTTTIYFKLELSELSLAKLE